MTSEIHSFLFIATIALTFMAMIWSQRTLLNVLFKLAFTAIAVLGIYCIVKG